MNSQWQEIPNSGDVIDVRSVMPDGRLLGVGKSNDLWVRTSLTSPWKAVPNSGNVIAATAMSDGTIIGVGMSKGLWVRSNLNAPWRAIPNSGAFINVADGNKLKAVCRYDLSPHWWFFNFEGGSGYFSISDFDNCGWYATEDSDWINLRPGYDKGVGSGKVYYDVVPNPSPNFRYGLITLFGSDGKDYDWYQVEQDGMKISVIPVYNLLLNRRL